jgi:hypothetical protein
VSGFAVVSVWAVFINYYPIALREVSRPQIRVLGLVLGITPLGPGPKGPSEEVVAAVVDMKQRNPIWGCPRIAQQITLAFGIPINKDVVRRILAARYHPKPNSARPSWLTVLGHAKDSLWSVDLFRCESAVLHTHWVLVVMD